MCSESFLSPLRAPKLSMSAFAWSEILSEYERSILLAPRAVSMAIASFVFSTNVCEWKFAKGMRRVLPGLRRPYSGR